jgi:hypothetical protein
MTELNVTALINRFSDDGDLDPMDLSGSICELGLNANITTWNNCLELASEATELNKLIIRHAQDVRAHFADYGAWDEDEIDGWTNQELIAITLQEAAASYRELESNDFDTENSSGRLYQGDIENDPSEGEWFLYLGS